MSDLPTCMSVYICVPGAPGGQKHQMPWNWGYRWFCVTPCERRDGAEPSARAAGSLSRSDSSPVLTFPLVFLSIHLFIVCIVPDCPSTCVMSTENQLATLWNWFSHFTSVWILGIEFRPPYFQATKHLYWDFFLSLALLLSKFLFCGAGDWARLPVHTRQELYRYTPAEHHSDDFGI